MADSSSNRTLSEGPSNFSDYEEANEMWANLILLNCVLVCFTDTMFCFLFLGFFLFLFLFYILKVVAMLHRTSLPAPFFSNSVCFLPMSA